MKKIPWDYIILFLQMTFAGIFILFVFTSYVAANSGTFLDRGMYSENVAGIQLSDLKQVSYGETVDFNPEDISADGEFAIYKNVTDEYGEIVRGIYETSDIFGFSGYLESGRFFNPDDFAAASKTAVIGASALNLTFEENGKRYYGNDGELYEVIGVFRETGTDLDNVVYLNLTSLLAAENDFGLYYVDGKSESTVESVIGSMEENVQGNYTTERVAYESTAMTGMGRGTDTFVFCALFSTVLYTISTLGYFVKSKKYTVAIEKLCGLTRKNLFAKYSRHVAVVMCAAYAGILILIYAIGNRFSYFETDYLGTVHFILLAVSFFAIGAAASSGVVFQSMRVDISDTLKGR